MPNHPNRSSAANSSRNPRHTEVVAARMALQTKDKENPLGITEAQSACATLLHTTLRTWQQWETGDRRMHPAFWELFQLKAKAKQ